MEKEKKPFDKKSLETKAMIDEIVHGVFMKEGTMVAFPTCFPGVTVPIAADESRITALDVTADGTVYGGTSGRSTHLFVGMFHGVTGIVLDMGTVAGADHCAAICCRKSKFVACVNGPGGGRIVSRPLQPLPFSLIQEWEFPRQSFKDMGEVVEKEAIIHAVLTDSKQHMIGTTEKHLFAMEMETGKIRIVADGRGSGQLGIGSNGSIFGLDEGSYLWRFDSVSSELKRKAIQLPDGAWGKTPLVWARDTRSGVLYTADGDGTLFAFSEEQGFTASVGRTMLAPVGAMAVTLDGRLFGWCGSELSRLFCYDPACEKIKDLGLGVSVIERRRYGYMFGAAVVGRDGQIFFGEDDELGHLWIYFPRIQ